MRAKVTQGRAVVGVHRQIVDEHRELVAGQPADHRVLVQISRQPFAQDLQRSIAGGVAEGVVDLFEPVQVQVQQRERALIAPRARDGLLQQMLELHAIRHFRERVVARQVADAAFGALALRDVARHVDVALKLRIFRGDRRTGHGHRNGLPAGGAQHRLARFGRGIGQIEGAAMHFIDEADQRLAEQFRLGIAEQLLRGFIAAFDEAVGRGDEHRVAQAVEHGVQVVLGDGGFVQLLPHALERELQIAEFVVALHGERPGVIAFADSIGALHQRGNRRRQPAGDEPGSEQSAQNQQRQREPGEHAADPLGLNALFAEQLRADAGQRLLHFGAAHPNPENADALHVALRDERIRAAGPRGGIAAGVQDFVARIQDLDALDVVLVEQPAGDRGNGGIVALA